MKNEELLYLAIGEIDEELIKEASAPYKKGIPKLYKKLTIAASVTIVSAAVIAGAMMAGAPSLDKSGSSPDCNNAGSPYEDFESLLTDNAGNSISEIKLLDEYTVSLRLRILSELTTPYELTMIGYSLSGDHSRIAICTTGTPSVEYDTVLSPTITVNGAPSAALPTSVGEYEITVDFSVISEHDFIWDDFLSINDYKYFIHK